VGLQAGEQREAHRREEQPADEHGLGPGAVGHARGDPGAADDRKAERQVGDAGLQRVVAEHLLQVQRAEEEHAEERGGDAKESDGDGEYVTDLLEVPGRTVSCVQGKERILEDGERINLSDGEMDCKSGGRDQPSAVSCWSY